MTTVEAFTAVRSLIADENRWAQAARARDDQGYQVLPNDPRAVRWCLLGAFEKADVGEDTYLACSAQLMKATSSLFLSHYNDHHPHAEVIAALDKVIAGGAQ